MKIEDNRKNEKTKLFENINIGECFEENDEIYIKTDITYCSKNAFSFKLNKMKTFDGWTRVTPIKAKVVTEE